MAGKRTKKPEDSRYHDTWRLLKKYRDVVWSMELSVQQVKKEFEIEFGSTIDDFLESVYLAGADLGGTKIESHAKCIERSNQMLTLLNNAVDLLRTRHKSGETYYWVLYSSYSELDGMTSEIAADLLDRVTIWPDGGLDIKLRYLDEIPSALNTNDAMSVNFTKLYGEAQ